MVHFDFAALQLQDTGQKLWLGAAESSALQGLRPFIHQKSVGRTHVGDCE